MYYVYKHDHALNKAFLIPANNLYKYKMFMNNHVMILASFGLITFYSYMNKNCAQILVLHVHKIK